MLSETRGDDDGVRSFERRGLAEVKFTGRYSNGRFMHVIHLAATDLAMRERAWTTEVRS